MYKLRLAVLTCATTATVLLALVAAGVAGADPRANFCDVENLWAASVFSAGLSNGEAFFEIFDQAPPAKEDDDGSETFQIALGLGNAGEGDKYHFRFETVLVSSGATARGHGFLFVGPTSASFVISGRGTHPLGGPGLTPGSFTVTGGGDVFCVAEEAVGASANVRVEYENGMTDENVFVNMARCENTEGCSPPGGEG